MFFDLRSVRKVALFDGDGFDYLSSIKNIVDGHHPHKRELKFEIENRIENPNLQIRELTLFQSIVKKDNFEFIVQKVTELGVSRIVPILSERSEKKAINEERLKKDIDRSDRAVGS